MELSESWVSVDWYGAFDATTEGILRENGYAPRRDAFHRYHECAPGQRVDSLVHQVIADISSLVRIHDLTALTPQLTVNGVPRLYQDGMIVTADEFVLLALIGGSILIDTYTG